MIYADPSAGEANGYNFDGWSPDEAGVFYYSGEGPNGDQQMTFGNKAILDHVERGSTLSLFEAVDGRKRTGGKLHRYVGLSRSTPLRLGSTGEAPAATVGCAKSSC